MILDSGSTTPLLARSLVSSGNLPTKNRIGSVNGQRVQKVPNVPLAFAGHTMEFSPVVWDHHNPALTPPVLIGSTLFLQTIVDMDFDSNRVSMIQSRAFTQPTAEWLSVRLSHGRPTVQVTVPGYKRTICAVIDTGFHGGLALTDKLIQTLGIPRDPLGGTTVMIGAVGERWERPNLAPLPEVRMAHVELERVSVRHANGSDDCGNVIGMEVLSRFRVIFDLPQRRVWLLPRMT